MKSLFIQAYEILRFDSKKSFAKYKYQNGCAKYNSKTKNVWSNNFLEKIDDSLYESMFTIYEIWYDSLLIAIDTLITKYLFSACFKN